MAQSAIPPTKVAYQTNDANAIRQTQHNDRKDERQINVGRKMWRNWLHEQPRIFFVLFVRQLRQARACHSTRVSVDFTPLVSNDGAPLNALLVSFAAACATAKRRKTNETLEQIEEKRATVDRCCHGSFQIFDGKSDKCITMGCKQSQPMSLQTFHLP